MHKNNIVNKKNEIVVNSVKVSYIKLINLYNMEKTHTTINFEKF